MRMSSTSGSSLASRWEAKYLLSLVLVELSLLWSSCSAGWRPRSLWQTGTNSGKQGHRVLMSLCLLFLPTLLCFLSNLQSCWPGEKRVFRGNQQSHLVYWLMESTVSVCVSVSLCVCVSVCVSVSLCVCASTLKQDGSLTSETWCQAGTLES